jgi:hypothetical protein
MSSFTTIEETAMLMNDTPDHDFACHYYNTRYERLKGIMLVMGQAPYRDDNTNSLVELVKARWEASFNRSLLTLNAEPNSTSWSMNWFRLRTSVHGTGNVKVYGKPYKLEADDRDAVYRAFTELLVAYPTLQGTLYIIQKEGSDTVLLGGHIKLKQPAGTTRSPGSSA